MEQQHEERRLTTILAADVVGYSRLMAIDETGTLAQLKTHRKEVIEPKTAEYHGRVVKLMGDGTLMEFGSVVDAIRFAVDVQRAMVERNASVPEDRQITYRVGINIGDIIVEGEDIYGDGINVAARLEALAEPGDICVSRTVFNHVKNKVELGFEDLGEQEFKNIPEPVRVYRIVEQEVRTLASHPVLNRPAVAVLPFDSLSGDPEQEYFADGITEDIITALSYWRWFPVIARNSTFAYKGRAMDVTQVARELGARYVLEGSVRKAGNRVRINAQLIDAPSGHHLWARRYDRDLSDIFALQDEITERIVASIEPELNRAEQERASRKHPESLDAWDHSLRALWHLNRMTKDDNAEACRLLQKAMELDPKWGGAVSLLALCQSFVGWLGWAEDPARQSAVFLPIATQAVALDEGDWLAHATLGMAHVWARQHERGADELERAIDLNPSAARAYHFLGFTLAISGRPGDAIAELNTALRLDPSDPLISHTLAALGLSHFLLRKFEDSILFAGKALRADPGNVRAHHRLVASLGHLGRIEEASAALRELLRWQPDFSKGYIDAAYPFKNPEHHDLILEGLRKAGWEGE
ncbi:MAG: adenylate/guanylate cyclase domain-containing protein [Hyphomicrobiaceae bacterium]